MVAGTVFGRPSACYSWSNPNDEGHWDVGRRTLGRGRDANWACCAPGVFVVSNENHAQGSVWPKSLYLKEEVEKLLASQSETVLAKDAWAK